MSRLTATLRLDAQLQARNNVYLIIAVAALGLAFALRALFTPEQLHFFMPLVALSGVSLTTYFLVGVLLLLERAEGTLDVVLVSPLRPGEYLASKLLTVTTLALVESVLLVGIAYGLGFSFLWLALGVMLRAGLVAAAGVAVVVRYRSITRFLFPGVLLTLAFDLPVLWYLELWPTPLFYLWPTLPSLLLAKAAFLPVEPLQLVYACVYGLLAAGAAMFWASRALDRFVVRGEIES
jgi:fluoroquinolone transport system permease protein